MFVCVGWISGKCRVVKNFSFKVGHVLCGKTPTSVTLRRKVKYSAPSGGSYRYDLLLYAKVLTFIIP